MTNAIHAERMTRRQAADYLSSIGCPTAVKTLAMYTRGHVEGPPYSLANGRAIYERSDLDAWAASRTSPKARTRAEHEDIARQAAMKRRKAERGNVARRAAA